MSLDKAPDEGVTIFSGQISTSVSGNIILVVSGGAVQVSGAIEARSGTTLPVTIQASGASLALSGLAVTPTGAQVSGLVGIQVRNSGNTLIDVGYASGIANLPLPILPASGSAIGVSGTVAISGQVIITSGTTIPITIQSSGAGVALSGVQILPNALQSGQAIVLSGGGAGISGVAVSVSGNTVLNRVPTVIRTGTIVLVTGSSGGTALSGSTNTVFSVVLKNFSGNATMYVGSSTNPPNSGLGFPLLGSESLSFDINNINAVQVWAATSGQLLGWLGVDQ